MTSPIQVQRPAYPAGIDDGTDAGAASGAPVATNASLLPSPRDMALFGGDPALEIGCLLIEQSQREHSEASQRVKNADDRQAAAEEKAATELHDEASDIRAEGWVEGACDIASGAAQVVGASYSLQSDQEKATAALLQDTQNGWSASGSVGSLGAMNDIASQAKAAASFAAAGDAFRGAIFTASSKVTDAVGHGIGGQMRASQKDCEARVKQHDADADEDKRSGDAAREVLREKEDHMQKVLDFMRDYVDGAHKARDAALSGIRG